MKLKNIIYNFQTFPFLVLWELTRACDLACKHCRADAQTRRHPLEVSTQEAFKVLEQIRSFHPSAPILVVLTGGDPSKRPDVMEIIRYSSQLGLRTTITPSGTGTLQKIDLELMKQNGLERVAISLDGSTPEIHDCFRGVSGSFEWSLRLFQLARECCLETQMNTTITPYNRDDFDNLAALCQKLAVSLWSVFFLVPTGRGSEADMIDAQGFEMIFEKMENLSRSAPFQIKSTAAPQYRRVVMQKRLTHGEKPKVKPENGGAGARAPGSVNDGNGILFISHTGEVYPSGFLPLSAGNIRKTNLVEIYRHSPLFRRLRNPDLLRGKCGICEYRKICGGSRARAYALSGDYLESDPNCVYMPKNFEANEQAANL